MQSLLGPHLLETPTPALIDELIAWEPPACVVLLSVPEDNLDMTQTLDDLVAATSAPAEDLFAPGIENHVLAFHKHGALNATKLVGRIYIDDEIVEDHINLSAVKAAEFHDHLVRAARKQLKSWLVDRVDYWVILNEKLGGNQGDLRKLGLYEWILPSMNGGSDRAGRNVAAHSRPSCGVCGEAMISIAPAHGLGRPASRSARFRPA